MNGVREKPAAAAPTTYQEWLDCFERMKELPLSGNGDFDVLAEGSFTGTGVMQAALEKQMVSTINAVLNKSIRRFVRDMNECIAFNELAGLDMLFKRLKRDVHRTTFFLELSFLSEAFKDELYASITDQMSGFWNDTVRFLQQQAMDSMNADLEDALYLIRRIRLFSQQR